MADDFAKDVTDRWTAAEEGDRENRKEALIDLEFEAGVHWDERVKEHRERMGETQYGFPLPCLTINDLPQKIGQVTGDWQANEASIKMLPREGGDKVIAETRAELVRGIELQSKAPRVYLHSFGQLVGCGIGNYRVDLDYAQEDAFERDLFIRSIPNPLAVLWDPLAADPTGRDAQYCFVSDKLRRSEYERQYKDKASNKLEATGLQADIDGDYVRVAEYWQIDERPATIAMMQDGSVVNVTGKPREDWLPHVFINGDKPMIREDAKCTYAKSVMTNGQEVLADGIELKLYRIPVIRCFGREVWIGDRRVRFGLTRFARDPARLKDYWRSVIAEKLMLSPRANFIADADAVEGREGDWQNTLIFNGGKTQPVPVTQNDLAAIMNEAQMCSQDMKDVTGLHDASLGIQSNETSGVAIQRRQNEGDIATIHYRTNMLAAMEETGEILNALIPIAYDTARTIRTVGEDGSAKLLRINDPNDPENIDISKGRYDVTISTGPAYATKRIEASQQLMEITRSAGGAKLLEVAPDLVMAALDIPNSDKFVERLKRAVPPQILGEDAEDDLTDEEKMQRQQAAQEAQQKQQVMETLTMRKLVAEAEKAEADARKANADAEATEKGRALDIQAHTAETQRIKAVTAKDFPLPAEALAILAPLVTQAVMNALGSPDVLPLHPIEQEMVAQGALRDATAPDPAEIEASEQGKEAPL